MVKTSLTTPHQQHKIKKEKFTHNARNRHKRTPKTTKTHKKTSLTIIHHSNNHTNQSSIRINILPFRDTGHRLSPHSLLRLPRKRSRNGTQFLSKQYIFQHIHKHQKETLKHIKQQSPLLDWCSTSITRQYINEQHWIHFRMRMVFKENKLY